MPGFEEPGARMAIGAADHDVAGQFLIMLAENLLAPGADGWMPSTRDLVVARSHHVTR